MTIRTPTLEQQKEAIDAYQSSLCDEIHAGSLLSKNSTAHKWQVTYRTIILRELVSWRFCDLMKQALNLEKDEFYLGSRILLRSVIETLALLIYSSEKMESIVRTGDEFHTYSKKSERLLLGTRDSNTKYDAISVLETLEKASKKHPELLIAYNDLSETAHPNFDGLFRAYSTSSEEGMLTTFRNRTSEIYKTQQRPLITLLLIIFEIEYNDRWIKAFSEFENWIEQNEAKLEKSKSA